MKSCQHFDSLCDCMKTWCPISLLMGRAGQRRLLGPGNWFLVVRKMPFQRLEKSCFPYLASLPLSCLPWGGGGNGFSHQDVSRHLSTQHPWLCGLLRAGACLVAANPRPGGLSPASTTPHRLCPLPGTSYTKRGPFLSSSQKTNLVMELEGCGGSVGRCTTRSLVRWTLSFYCV